MLRGSQGLGSGLPLGKNVSLCLEWTLPKGIWGEPLSPKAVCVATAIVLLIARPLTAWAEGEDLGWSGSSIFGADVSEGHGFYGSNSERSGAEDLASLDSSDGSVRVDGKIITLLQPNADAQNVVVGDSTLDVSSFKLDLNAIPAAVRDDDSVFQDYLKFLASGATDSDGATPGFWSDHMVALTLGMMPHDKSSHRIRVGCSSNGSVRGVYSCYYFEAVSSNLGWNSGAAESGADEQDNANNNSNNNNSYNFNGYSNNFANNSGVGGAHVVAPGTSVVSGFDLVTTANPCGCEVTMLPAPIPVSGMLTPEFYGSTAPDVQSGFGASSPQQPNDDGPTPPGLGQLWPSGNLRQTSSAVPELSTSTLFLIGAGGLALAMRRARNPLRGLFRA